MTRLENVSHETLPKKLPEPVALDQDRLDRLNAYEALLTKWNQRINLVSPKDLPHFKERHIRDTLQWTGLLPKNTPILDLGSGGGIPAVITAIALNAPVTMIESDVRKCAFLREAARVCGLDAQIINDRIENVSMERAPLITARALAPLSKLLEWSDHLIAEDGIRIFPKGRSALQELTDARKIENIQTEIFASETSPDACIFRIYKSDSR